MIKAEVELLLRDLCRGASSRSMHEKAYNKLSRGHLYYMTNDTMKEKINMNKKKSVVGGEGNQENRYSYIQSTSLTDNF